MENQIGIPSEEIFRLCPFSVQYNITLPFSPCFGMLLFARLFCYAPSGLLITKHSVDLKALPPNHPAPCAGLQGLELSITLGQKHNCLTYLTYLTSRQLSLDQTGSSAILFSPARQHENRLLHGQGKAFLEVVFCPKPPMHETHLR